MSRRNKVINTGGNLVTAGDAGARKKDLGQEAGNQVRGFGYKPVEPCEERIRQNQLTARQKKKLIPQAASPSEREADLERVRAIRSGRFRQKRSESQRPLSKRDKQSKKQERELRSEQLYLEAARIEAERKALRRIEITRGDEIALGSNSFGRLEFMHKFRSKLEFLKKANIRRADEAASALNRMGFKTRSGQLWTARLVNVAKMKLFGFE
jgi:hypothetical protein